MGLAAPLCCVCALLALLCAVPPPVAAAAASAHVLDTCGSELARANALVALAGDTPSVDRVHRALLPGSERDSRMLACLALAWAAMGGGVPDAPADLGLSDRDHVSGLPSAGGAARHQAVSGAATFGTASTQHRAPAAPARLDIAAARLGTASTPHFTPAPPATFGTASTQLRAPAAPAPLGTSSSAQSLPPAQQAVLDEIFDVLVCEGLVGAARNACLTACYWENVTASCENIAAYGVGACTTRNGTATVTALYLSFCNITSARVFTLVLELRDLEQLGLSSNELDGSLPPAWSSLAALDWLHVASNNISGSLPREWGALALLSSLRLENNHISGSLPREWSALSSLFELHLAQNALSGSLPREWSALTSLSLLELDANALGGTLPADWSGLSALNCLALDDNRIAGTLPREWHAMQRLTSLFVRLNLLSGSLPVEWSSMVSLSALAVDHNQLTGSLPAEWSTLALLSSLSVAHNRLSGGLPGDWGDLVLLAVVEANNNRLTGSLPSGWGAILSLSTVHLEHNQLVGSLPVEWSALNSLSKMFADHNQLSGSLPADWSALSSLGWLDIDHNQLSGSLPGNWSALSALHALYADHNQLSGSLPADWSALSSLETLTLGYNGAGSSGGGGFVGTLPAAWAAMPSLTVLFADRNSLSGTLPAEWRRMARLEVLVLAHNALGGSFPAEWSALSSLSRLDLLDNALVGSLPAALSRCSRLGEVDLSVNMLEGSLPVAWSALQSLQVLRVAYNGLVNGTLPSAWSALSALFEFHAPGCSLSGTLPASWGRLSTLSLVAINTNAQLGGSLPDAWSALGALESLQLYSTALNGTLPDSWSALRSLSALGLGGTEVSGTLPAAWASMTAMAQLYLQAASLSGTLPAAWSRMTLLEQLHVNGNRLSGSLPAAWSTLARLTLATIGGNVQLGGSLPAEWSTLTALYLLNAENTSIGGSLPTAWTSLAGLQQLYLADTLISGSIPAALGLLPRLAMVDLSRTLIGGALPIGIEWTGAGAMIELRVAGTGVRGTVDLFLHRAHINLPSSLSVFNGLDCAALGVRDCVARVNRSLETPLAPSADAALAACLSDGSATGVTLDAEAPARFDSERFSCPTFVPLDSSEVTSLTLQLSPTYLQWAHCVCDAMTSFRVPPAGALSALNGSAGGDYWRPRCFACRAECSCSTAGALVGCYPEPVDGAPSVAAEASAGEGNAAFYVSGVYDASPCPPLESGVSACNPPLETTGTGGTGARATTRSADTSPVVFRCAQGAHGRLCSRCSPGYFLSNRECVECSSSARTLLALLYSCGSIVLAVYLGFQPPRSNATLKITLFYVQTLLAIVRLVPLAWPSWLRRLTGHALNTASFSPLGFECLLPSTMHIDNAQRYLAYLVAPFAIMAVVLGTVGLMAVIERARRRRQGLSLGSARAGDAQQRPPRFTAARVLFVFNALVNLFYFDLSQKMLDAFGCTLRSAAGRAYLNALPATTCELGADASGEYTTVLSVAVVGLIVFVLGYPLAMALQLRVVRRRASMLALRSKSQSFGGRSTLSERSLSTLSLPSRMDAAPGRSPSTIGAPRPPSRASRMRRSQSALSVALLSAKELPLAAAAVADVAAAPRAPRSDASLTSPTRSESMGSLASSDLSGDDSVYSVRSESDERGRAAEGAESGWLESSGDERDAVDARRTERPRVGTLVSERGRADTTASVETFASTAPMLETRARSSSTTPEALVQAPVSFFTASYRRRFWWYEFVVLARRLVMTLTVAIVPFTQPLVLLFSFALVLIASLLAHHPLHPFRARLDNILETVSLYVLLVVLIGTSTVTARADPAVASALVTAMIVLALLFAVVCLVLSVLRLVVGVIGARCCRTFCARIGMPQLRESRMRSRARSVATVLGANEDDRD